TRTDMNRLAATAQHIYLGGGDLALNVDGTGVATETATWVPAAIDWIELAEFDSSAGPADNAIEIFNAHVPAPSWSQTYLGWAEILRWTLRE
ncbi:MAG: hypothetical protein V3T05_00930, partial [Myxococcota bacterium]